FVTGSLPDTVGLRDIGEVRLRGMSAPERVLQIVAACLPVDFPPLAAVTAPNNLPAPITTFFGREEEMRLVLDSLTQSRLVTLVGFGGSGKTRMSIEAAAAANASYLDGIWFVDLAPVQSSERVPQAVASTVGVSEAPGEDLTDTLAGVLRFKRVLVLLDNCEHVISEAARFAERLLARTDELRVLATSRQKLNVPGEVILELPPLTVGHGSSPGGPAVQLFIDRARAARPSFTPTDDELAAVAEICAHLDGIPLAIELAAARVRMLRPTQIARRLDDRFAFLVSGTRTARPRQQTLRSLVDWSYELLGKKERALFDRLSVFAGGFTVEAAEAVCAGGGIDATEVFDILASLLDQSMVQIEDSELELRFKLLETLREYGRERLEGAGEDEVFRARHADFFAARVDGTDERLKGPEQGVWHQRLEADDPDLLRALSWLTIHRPDRGLEMAAELGRFWYRKGTVTMGKELTAAALAAVGDEPSVARGRALVWLAFFVGVLGDSETARAFAFQALDTARRCEDANGEALALNHLGSLAQAVGRPREAVDNWQNSIEVLDRAGIPWVAAPLFNLGNLYAQLGELGQARSVALRLAELGRQNVDPWAAAKGRLLAGYVAHGEGRLDEAEEEARAAEEMFVQQGVAIHAADAIKLRAAAAELRGDTGEAMRQLERAREMIEPVGTFDDMETQLLRIRIALRDEDTNTAVTALKRGFVMDLRVENPIDRIALLHESARLAVLSRRYEEAVRLVAAVRVQRKAIKLQAASHATEEEVMIEAATAKEIGPRRVRDL
ncbi:MAG TPA: NB-ARC domain-containing protein, partial [Woeseiaceae bacterium]|nr:NB-ARC domain-containing protein [Woeseiaceae bacterium]